MVAQALAALAVSGQVAFLNGTNLVRIDLATGAQKVVARNALQPVAWSGDGKLLSAGNRVIGGPTFPTQQVAWAQTGETLAYLTRTGAVVVWSPAAGSRTVVRAGWGARTIAWGPGGRLAVGRKLPTAHEPRAHEEVWVWHAGSLRRVVGPLKRTYDTTPIVAGFAPDGRVLWWDDEFDSASIATDGLWLYANRTRLARTLVFPDFVQRCGTHLVLAAGIDRYATHGKRILLDGRDISRDATRSWVSPSCSADGSTVVAAAGRNWEEPRIGQGERRSIWQLLPTRKQLTTPPAGWTDENPRVLADGSILFVRTHLSTRTVNGEWTTTTRAELELLGSGMLTQLGDFTSTARGFIDYYGHYSWPWLLAVAP